MYPRRPDMIPPGTLESGRYRVRYATDDDDLRAVQRVRFDVFNVELGEGLCTSHATGLDADTHDAHCHHLMVIDRETERTIGTYRMSTRELLGRASWYSDAEFHVGAMPGRVTRGGVEVGRACIEAEHRNGRVLQLLWKGIARYLAFNDKRYLFGCCSIAGFDPATMAAVSSKLTEGGHLHPGIEAAARPDVAFASSLPRGSATEVELPPLFASYLRLGAKVCGGPAIDREFGVTDYFVLLDVADVPASIMSRLSTAEAWLRVA